MPTLLLSSRNAHKAEEIAAILDDRFTVQTLAIFPAAPEVEEDADNFSANAVKKANGAVKKKLDLAAAAAKALEREHIARWIAEWGG